MGRHGQAFAQARGVVGLLNIQFAVKNGIVYVLEVNPRASRTVPFVSKATGVPLAKLAAAVMAGRPLDEFGVPPELSLPCVAGEEAGVPLPPHPGAAILFGPGMRRVRGARGVAATISGAVAQ